MAYTVSEEIKKRISANVEEHNKKLVQIFANGTAEDRAVKHAQTKYTPQAIAKASPGVATKTSSPNSDYKVSSEIADRIRANVAANNSNGNSLDLSSYKTYIQPPSTAKKGEGVQMTKKYSEKRMQDVTNNLYAEYGGRTYDEIMGAIGSNTNEDPFLRSYESAVLGYIAEDKKPARTRADIERDIADNEAELEVAEAEFDAIANDVTTMYGDGNAEEYNAASERVNTLLGKRESLNSELWFYDKNEQYSAIPFNTDYAQNNTSTNLKTNDAAYNFINDVYGGRDEAIATKSAGSNTKYLYMSEEQKGIYNYLYNTSGKEAADEYLDYIEFDLNRQRQEEIRENAYDYASSGGGRGFLGSVASVPTNLVSGIGYLDVLGQKAQRAFSGSDKPVDYNRGAQSAYNYTQGMREGTRSTMDTELGKSVYDIGMSMADSAVIALLTMGGLGLAGGAGATKAATNLITNAGTSLLGGSAATSTMHEVKARGGNDAQALTMGLVAGAAEMVMERLPLDNLFKIGNVKNARQFVYQMLKQGGIEATEEVLTTLANTVADIVIMGDKTQLQVWQNEYMSMGYSEEEAASLAGKQWLKGLMMDAVGGFMSGLGFGLGGAVAGSVRYRNSDATQNTPYGEVIPELVEESKALGGSRTADRIQRRIDNDRTVRTKDVNRLVKENDKGITNKDVSTIQTATESRLVELGETGDTTLIAGALAKQVAGIKPSQKEMTAFNNSKYGQRVANELNADNIRTGDYASEWAQKIGTERVNANEYNRLTDKRSDVEKLSDKYGAQAGAMVAKYDGKLDPEAYDKGFKAVYEVGKEGGNLEAIKSNPLVKDFTESQIQVAYEAGQAATKTIAPDSVESIESVGKNKTTVKLTNGNTVNIAEGVYTIKGYAAVLDTIGKLGVNKTDANTIFKTFDTNTNADTFALGVAEAFRYGKTGMSQADLVNNSKYAKKLTLEQRNAAYDAGKKIAQENVEKAQARANARKGTRVGEVHINRSVDSLKATQKTTYDAAVILAKTLGVEIYFYESYKKNGTQYYVDERGREAKAPNGWFDPKDNSIHLDLNAGRNGEGIVLFTLAHELTHYIKRGSPTQFKLLGDTIFEHLGKNGTAVESLITDKMDAQGISYEAAYEEVVADSLETVLNSGNVLEALVEIKRKDANLWSKISDFFKKFVKRLRNLVDTYADVRPDSREGNLVKDIEGLIAKLEPIFTEGLVQASENMGDEMTNEQAFTDSSVAIMNQIRPPYTDGSKGFIEFTENLNPEAKETFDLFYGFYQKSLVTNALSVRGKVVKKANISSLYLLAQDWNDMLSKEPKWAAAAKELADFLPTDVRKRMNMNEDGTLNPTPMEKEFRMPSSLAQRLVDALPYESIDAEYTLGDKQITLPEGKARQSVGGEAYRRAILAETRKLYSEGKLKQVSIGAMSKDKWGSMGFLAANGKTGASGDFTTVCPQMMFNRGCWYCYRRAAMESGVNNKLVAQNVWYTGEILRIKDSVINDLNKNGGLRIQSFGDWMPHFSAMLADVLYDAELRGLQVKIITKEPSMINYIAALREQGIGKNLYFNLSADYTIEKGPAKQATSPDSLDVVNPERPFMRKDGDIWWKRAMTVEEASKYRSKYDWVNTRIVASTLDEFIRGLKDPTVDVVTGYHGNIRQYDRIDSATGKRVVEVEALGDAGMPRFAYNPVSDSWIVEYEGKTATHKKLAAAIMENNLQMAYYTKTCCITGRCATCNGKCGALSKDFNVKNATNRDAESVAYWRQQMQYAIEPEFGDMTTDDGVMYQARNSIDPNWQSYELEEEFLREVPYGDRHLFLRSLANQTSDIADGGNKRIVITGGSTLYFFNATGYMNGNLEGKMALTDNNQPVVRTVRKEYLNGTYTGTETSDQMAQSFEVQRGRSGWDYAAYEHPRKKRRPDDVAVEESDDDTFGDYWEILGYSTYEEFVEAVKSGTMIMDENGDLITFDDGDGVYRQQRGTDALSNRAESKAEATKAVVNESDTVEGAPDLVAFHNTTLKLLTDILNRNGLLMPSLAITNKSMTDFGEISLLFDKSTIDPNSNKDNKLYGADAWTPTQIELKKNAKFDSAKTSATIDNIKSNLGSHASKLFNVTPAQFVNTINKSDGSVYDAYAHNIGMQTAYALESGIITEIPTNKNGTVNMGQLRANLKDNLNTDNGWRVYKRWLNKISDTVITSYDKATNADILRNMKAQPATAKNFELSETGELVVPAVEYRSIDEVRQNKGRLSENAADATKAVADKFLALAKKMPTDTKSAVDAINKTYASRYSVADIVRSFAKQGINISVDTANELQNLYKAAVELPTQYFEAKPGGQIGIDQIRYAVMPDTPAYDWVRGELEKAGVKVVSYAEGSNDSRVSAINAADDIKFQQRAEESFSNRELLANALSSAVQNDSEQKRLDEYKNNVQKLNEQETRLAEIDADLAKVTDPKVVKMLTEERTKTQNRINVYDSKLLKLEATAPLKALVDRERAAAYEKAKARGDENLRRYRERTEQRMDAAKQKYRDARDAAVEKAVERGEKKLAKQKERSAEVIANIRERNKESRQKAVVRERAKKQEAVQRVRDNAEKKLEETKTHYQEARKRNVEQRKTTVMRNKVKNIVNELNSYLLKGTKDRHVPIELQKPVAAALEAINMDSIGAEQRIADLDARIATYANDPVIVEQLTASKERILKSDAKLQDKLSSLKSAYDAIKESTDPLVANSYDEVISSTIAYVVNSVGDTSIRDMTFDQLSDVYKMYKMILTKIRDANKAFASNKKLGITEMSENVIGELKKFVKESDKSLAVLEGIKTFDWNNLKPVYAFERIGSSTLTGLYDDLRMGEDTWIKDAEEAKKFFNDVATKYKYFTWDMDKQYPFTSRMGSNFSLSLQQILSLYAYSKRGQAEAHLSKGGFVFDSSIQVVEKKRGVPVKYNVTTSTAFNLSPEILGEIIGTLTPEQRAFADEMQSYLSDTMGEKGNEVTLQMYGVKLFEEKNYFPLKSAKQFLFEQNEVAGEIRLKNSGFTKEVKPQANNPIILSDFIDVWAKHVNDMAMYHSFVLPLEDFTRVYNFKTVVGEDTQTESVKNVLENAFGKQASGYISQLLKDVNGGVVTDSRETLAKRLIANFKKASVFASLSVVVQQPSAIGRAFAIINPKYFIGDKVDAKRHKVLWAELKKYAPVAAVKEMGYFDTNMGRSASDYITGQSYTGIKDKVKGFVKDADYRDEVLSKLPALADELTWCAIWDAVKRETRDKNPKLKVGSEDFLTIAGQRFTEVITKTQVYDSVFSRSANMRSKSAIMGMWTAFMAEPTTTANMVQDAITKFKRGDKKQLPKVLGAVFTSILINSVLRSFVYAMRDDDEDETFIEKYISSFATAMLDGINPLTYLPFVKDVWSVAQGYDVERADMTLITKLWDSTDSLSRLLGKDVGEMDDEEREEHRSKITEALMGVGDNIASLFGIPWKNVRRDLAGTVNVVRTIVNDVRGRDTTWASLVDNVSEEVRKSIPFASALDNKTKQDKLYEAITSGDTSYAERIMNSYSSESALNTAIRKALRENDSRIAEAAEAKLSGDTSTYYDIVEEIVGEGYFSEDNVIAAIKAEANSMTEKSESGTSAQVLFNADDYFNAVVYGDAEDAKVVRDELVQASVEKGNTQRQAESSVASSFVTNVKNAYSSGVLDEDEAIDFIVDYGGKSEEEAVAEIKKADFENKYGYTWGERDNAFRLGAISEEDLISAYVDIEGKSRTDAVAAVEKLKFTNEYGFDYDDRKEAYASGAITRTELRNVLVEVGGKTAEDAEYQIMAYDWQIEGYDIDSGAKTFFEDYNAYIAPAGIGKGVYYNAYKFYGNAGVEGESYSKVKECMPYIDSLPLSDAQKTALALCWWSEKTVNKYKTW